ncbi:hypothetical protein Tco_1333284, partial [Tanacetum coccineum]
SVSKKNQMKHPNEYLMMPLMTNLKKNDQQNVSQQDDNGPTLFLAFIMCDLWVEAVISVKGIPWVGDDGVSGVSLSLVLSSDDKNGEVAGNGGIWSDDGSSGRSESESDAGE